MFLICENSIEFDPELTIVLNMKKKIKKKNGNVKNHLHPKCSKIEKFYGYQSCAFQHV